MVAGITVKFSRKSMMVKIPDALNSVFVGVTRERNARQNEPNGATNAEIYYYHEFGTVTEPARPSLIPGIRQTQPYAIKTLETAYKRELKGRDGAVDAALDLIGRRAVQTVRGIIRAGIPPPIAEATKANRLRKKKAYLNASPSRRDAMMNQWMSQEFTPLLDTQQMLRSIGYEVRKKK